jgi:hypothetical protein
VSHRLAPGDQRELLFVDALVVCIHGTLALDHVLGELRIPLGVGMRGLANLIQNQTAHFDDAHVEGRERAIERATDVPFHRQPNRPVM